MTSQQRELDFHNTINETGERLTELKQNAQTQQEKILKYFWENQAMACTPWEIQKYVLPNAPITSIRRAMTNLTNEGRLEKLGMQRVETYGVKNHYWSLKRPIRE